MTARVIAASLEGAHDLRDLDALVAKLDSDRQEVQVDALQSLRFLCHKPGIRIKLREAGLPAQLVSVMSTAVAAGSTAPHASEIMRDGLSIAQSLTGRPEYLPVTGQLIYKIDDWEPSIVDLLQAGAVPLLAVVLCSDEWRQHWARCMYVLSNLGRAKEYATAAVIGQEQALTEQLQLILADVKDQDEDLRLSALVLVATLSRARYDEQLLTNLAQDGNLIEALELGLRDAPPASIEKCLWALGNFASSEHFKHRILEGGVLQDVEAFLGCGPRAGNLLLRFTALKFCAFAFRNVTDELCGKVFGSSPHSLLMLLSGALKVSSLPVAFCEFA